MCVCVCGGGGGAEGIITACHLTFAGPKGLMSDQNLVWSDILANEIIRTRLNVWQILDWSDILSDHFRKVIIPTGGVQVVWVLGSWFIYRSWVKVPPLRDVLNVLATVVISYWRWQNPCTKKQNQEICLVPLSPQIRTPHGRKVSFDPLNADI